MSRREVRSIFEGGKKFIERGEGSYKKRKKV